MSTSSASEEKPKKRATRKRVATTRASRTRAATRAPRKAVPKKTVRKKTPRKTTAKRVVAAPAPEPAPAPITESAGERKAPTRLAHERSSTKARRNQLIVVAVLLLTGVGASAAVGVTDAGQIDVNKAIEERNERIRSGQGSEEERVFVPVQNTTANQLPDGGLVGLGIGGAIDEPKPPAPATTTASSTATSTDSVAPSTIETIDTEEIATEADEVSEAEIESEVETEPTTTE